MNVSVQTAHVSQSQHQLALFFQSEMTHISYINDHYHDPELNISQISAHVSYSENHLSNLFRRQTGGSIVQYITKCRMSEAYRLLREGMSVSQVASVTGYTSPYYFSRRFKQYYGFPPSILFE